MGSYELSEFLHDNPVRHHLAHHELSWYGEDVRQSDFVLTPSPYKRRVPQSKHGRSGSAHRNWKVRSEFWKIEFVYETWYAAIDAARMLATTGRVCAFRLLGAQAFDAPF